MCRISQVLVFFANRYLSTTLRVARISQTCRHAVSLLRKYSKFAGPGNNFKLGALEKCWPGCYIAPTLIPASLDVLWVCDQWRRSISEIGSRRSEAGGGVIMWVCITKTFECRDHQRHCKESGENFTKCPQLSCFGALLRTVFVNINFYFFSKNMFLIFSLILFLKFYFFQRLAFGFVKNVQLNLKCWYESSVVHRTNLQKWLISAIADSLRHAER